MLSVSALSVFLLVLQLQLALPERFVPPARRKSSLVRTAPIAAVKSDSRPGRSPGQP